MDKEEAMKIFIQRNIKALTSQNATAQIVKKLRQNFKSTKNLKSHEFFTNKDVAKAIIKEITCLKKDEEHDTIRQILETIPFITMEVSDDTINTIIIENLGITSSILTKEDLSKLGSETYLEEVNKKFEKKAMEKVQIEMAEEKEKLEELITENEQEKENLKKFRSELDELPPVIELKKEDLKIEVKTGINEVAWWKKIGLLGNPFPPDFKGLIGIPEELYDNIVVRTRFVNSYLQIIENNPEELLGISTVIIGEYGACPRIILNAGRDNVY